jgi:AcrR family transcriptional regulator
VRVADERRVLAVLQRSHGGFLRRRASCRRGPQAAGVVRRLSLRRPGQVGVRGVGHVIDTACRRATSARNGIVGAASYAVKARAPPKATDTTGATGDASAAAAPATPRLQPDAATADTWPPGNTVRMTRPAAAAPAPAEPRARDADRSQKDILDAALQEFAAYGLGGARMDRIAERAGVNKRLIYYYFESKESLFLCVLELAYENIRGEEQQLNLSQVDPIEAVRRLIAFTWNYYLAHPEFLTLLNSENLHRARHLKQSAKVRSMNSPLIQTLADVLERGHKAGVFRAGVDPVQLYISIAGLSYFYLGNCHTLSTIFDRDLMGAKARLERLSHMNDLVLGYLVRD